MPRGAPDWGEYAQQELLIRTFDLGELAARLGSPSILERGGSIIFMDNFQDGYNRWTLGLQTNCNIVLSHRKTFAGGYSARWAYSGQQTNWSSLITRIPYLYASTYGMETEMLFDGANISIYNGIRLVIGGTYYMFYYKVIPSTKALYVYTPSGDVLITDDLAIDTSGDVWIFAKLIVDLVKMRYWRLKINERSFDISTYSPYTAAITEGNNVALAVQTSNSGAAACNFYLGAAILTINEYIE